MQIKEQQKRRSRSKREARLFSAGNNGNLPNIVANSSQKQHVRKNKMLGRLVTTRKWMHHALQLTARRLVKAASTISAPIISYLHLRPLLDRLSRLFTRSVIVGLTVIIIFSVVVPIVSHYLSSRAYALSAKTSSIVGTTNKNLAAKLSFDTQKQAYIFNKAGLTSAPKSANDPANPGARLRQMKSRVGGSSAHTSTLYSVTLPKDPTKGITYTDNNVHLSFTLTALSHQQPGKNVAGQLVYPADQNIQDIYTPKANGLKEDVVLSQKLATSQETLRYHLNLPPQLQARLMNDGSLGIYSADPSLYGNISYGGASDRAAVMKARVTSVKNNLVFALPAPVIKQYKAANVGSATARFSLAHNMLTLDVNNLNTVPVKSYPLSIDPSVVVASTSSFATGNNGGNIDYPVNQIKRGGLNGGTLNAGWSTDTTNPLLDTINAAVTEVYNGYVYEIGGYDGTKNLATVYYAPLSSTTGIGTWVNDTTNPLPQVTDAAASIVYDGYIYVMGGYQYGAATPTYYNSVYYAPLASNGSVGAWILSTNPLPGQLEGGNAVVTQGYVYYIDGYNGTSQSSSTYYAAINADGSIGAWTTNPSTLPVALDVATSVVYNGYVYVIGGYTTAPVATVYYAALETNHSLGSWLTDTASPLPQGVDGGSIVVDNGYIYEIGGYNGTSYLNTVYVAGINSDGSLATWHQTTVLPQATSYNGAVASGGTIYVLGGTNSTATLNTIYYGAIDPAGGTGVWTTTSALPKQTNAVGGYSGREGNALVAYNGYLFSLGGDAGTTELYDAYAQINADGSLGAWAGAANLPSSYTGLGAMAYDGYMYIFDGCSGLTSGTCTTKEVAQTYSAPISSAGVIGAWTSLAAPPTSVWNEAVTVNNGYVYLLGGEDTTQTYTTTVSYAQLTSTGGLSANAGCGTAWCSTGSFNVGRDYEGAAVSGNYMYVAGGTHATSDTACSATASYNCSDVQYALITSTGALSANTCGTSVTWCATTSLPAPITGAVTASKGYLNTSEGYYSLINNNGTVANWGTTTAFTTARIAFGATFVNDTLYIVGGLAGTTYQADAQYAPVNNGGSGATGSWTTAANLPTQALYADSTFAYHDFIYQLGGNTGSAVLNTINYAQINPDDGSLGAWTANSVTLPFDNESGTYDFYDGNIYDIGGTNTTVGNYNTVYYAPVSSTLGTIGNWTLDTTAQLPNPLFQSTSQVYNGYLYVMGGSTGAATNPIINAVDYAPINSDGSVGAWTATSSLINPTDFLGSVASGGYMYVIGGYNGSAPVNTVSAAPINSNGTLGAWANTTNLPIPIYAATTESSNGFVYEMGGYSSAALQTIYMASIHADGTIGNWSVTSSMPNFSDSSAAVVYHGYLYQVEGYNGTAAVNSVYYTPLYSQPRIGMYSKMIDLGALSYVSGITYTGLLPFGLGAITYSLAGSNAVFNTATLSTTLTGSLIGSNCGSGGTSARYVLIHLSLDDTHTGSTFPDINSTSAANLTNITVNYYTHTRAPTNLRLRQGAFFTGSILQPLDTCNS